MIFGKCVHNVYIATVSLAAWCLSFPAVCARCVIFASCIFAYRTRSVGRHVVTLTITSLLGSRTPGASLVHFQISSSLLADSAYGKAQPPLLFSSVAVPWIGTMVAEFSTAPLACCWEAPWVDGATGAVEIAMRSTRRRMVLLVSSRPRSSQPRWTRLGSACLQPIQFRCSSGRGLRYSGRPGLVATRTASARSVKRRRNLSAQGGASIHYYDYYYYDSYYYMEE